jgi:hypothetical protein
MRYSKRRMQRRALMIATISFRLLSDSYVGNDGEGCQGEVLGGYLAKDF